MKGRNVNKMSFIGPHNVAECIKSATKGVGHYHLIKFLRQVRAFSAFSPPMVAGSAIIKL